MVTSGEQVDILKRKTAEVVSEDDLREKLERASRASRPLRVKLGLDPSAPDIHLGHAVVLRKLREFQDLGHEVVLVVGDFTGRIGDPTGKSETRRQLSADEVMRNARTYQEQAYKILDPARTRIAFNSEWLSKLTFEDVINLASKYTVARMLERDEFNARFRQEQPIYIHEFFYPFMQAYDSVALQADVELGGTDQKFNILFGRMLQREYDQEPQVAMLMPILVGTDGVNKMSKSLGNYIGVAEPPSQMYGKTMSISDDVMMTFYELATALPDEEIETVRDELASGRLHPRDAKRRLAREIVALYHGWQAAKTAEEEFDAVFRKGELPEEVPEAVISVADLDEGKMWCPKLLVATGLAGSTSEARRLMDQGAVRVDDERLVDPQACVAIRDGTIIRVGKRRFARVRLA
ncbi:MAG: tyrosine--tRNA ligase [Firmicutes bacterium]|nr:tyrosine--tRNA ligase [Bacillota bacterium]MDH7496094.1 tyrosine--tRNA ligase [Bacillota bacterium]